MSDKNRNMNDINDQKTAEQQAFSEEIRRRLAEPGSGKPTLDEFKVMVYKDREKRRKKRNALVACIVAAFVVGYLTYDDLVPEVGADKNPKETIQTEDGVIIEDGGYGSSEEADNVFIIEDWLQVDDAKTISTKIIIPKTIPKGYMFDKLEIETLETGAIACEYIFINDNQHIIIDEYIPQNTLSAFDINEYTRIINHENNDIYILEEENKIATMYMDDGIILNVWGMLSDEEIIDIMESMIY